MLILVAYVMATVGAIYFLFFKGEREGAEVADRDPGAGRRVRLLHDLPQRVRRAEGTFARLPYIEVVYLIIGLVVVCVAPGLAGRVRAGLAAGSVP